jgi:Ca2+-binding EF-hand superfamily protein
MIKSVDKDGDERVDFMEFQQMMSGGFSVSNNDDGG